MLTLNLVASHAERKGMMRLDVKKIIATIAACMIFAGIAPAQSQTPQQLAWSILQSGATNTNSQQRVSAITALALITADPKAVTMAQQALQDQTAAVRAAAATTLGTLKAQSAIPALQQALNDTDPSVIMAAAKALVGMNDEYGYNAYYAVATGQRKSGEGLVAGQEKELNTLLHNPKDLAETAFEQGIGFVPFGGISYGAFKAIRDRGADATVVKATAYRMLAKDPDPRSGKALVAATTDQDWVIRAAAFDALAHRGDRSLLPDITNGLNDQQQVVKLTAAAAVAQLSALK